MDQGNDAVHVREILERQQLQLRGPETSIFGIYAGPLWYYFLAIGYGLFSGHPFGGLLMVILLNILTSALIMRRISHEISPRVGLLVGAMLQTSWWYYDIARYAFNPFPLVPIGFVLLFWLTDALRGQSKKFIWTAILLGLGFNSELAGSVAMTIFCLLVGLYLWYKKVVNLKHFFAWVIILSIFLLPHFISEIQTNFSQTHTAIREFVDPEGIFSNTQFKLISQKYFNVISRSIFRRVPELGVLLFCIILVLFFKKNLKKNTGFVYYFICLTLFLLIVSWLFFASNQSWRDWHTVYLSPLMFVSVLLALTHLPRWIAIPILTLSLYSHVEMFSRRYQKYFLPSSDPSLLVNEVAVIDWVYAQAQGQGFNVYTYLPSIFDYPYQYLFWWHGKKQYGYLPCEYSTFPGIPTFNVPGKKYYSQPIRSRQNLRFLIAEPDINNPRRRQEWLESLQKHTTLIKTEQIGNISVSQVLLDQN